MEDKNYDDERIEIDRLETVTGGAGQYTRVSAFHQTSFNEIVKKDKKEGRNPEETIKTCLNLVFSDYHKEIYARGVVEEYVRKVWDRII